MFRVHNKNFKKDEQVFKLECFAHLLLNKPFWCFGVFIVSMFRYFGVL